jgi:dienelactone hydrolase
MKNTSNHQPGKIMSTRRHIPLALVPLLLGSACLPLTAETLAYYQFEDSPGVLADSDGAGRNLEQTTGTGTATQITSPFGDAITNPPAGSVANTQAISLETTGKIGLSTADFAYADLTIEAFVNLTSTDTGGLARVIASQFGTESATRTFNFGVAGNSSSTFTADHTLFLQVNTSAGVIKNIDSGFRLELGTDYFVAVAIDPGSLNDGADGAVTFFLKNLSSGGGGDGELQTASIVVTGLAAFRDTTVPVTIGSANNGGSSWWHGVIDEVRFSNTALTGNQLLIAAAAVPEPTTSALVSGGIVLVATAVYRRRQRACNIPHSPPPPPPPPMHQPFPMILACCLLAAASSPPLRASSMQQVVTYTSTITADAQGPLDLTMELNYEADRTGAPIMVIMHQYTQATGNFADYRANAQRLRDAGFFVITVAMRGRDGSDGTRDTGGLEIYDIYDAIEHVKTRYGDLVDPGNISITGYSGGGGNVMSAITKFPDYFRAASAFFGMSDYGYDPTTGWYNNGASAAHRATLNADIGNPGTNDPAVRDRYMARASSLASMNNPYTEIHLFVNENETTCPPVNATRYRDNARAAATFDGEFDNITVHIGKPGLYEDFNANGLADPGEEQNWPHQAPTATQQAAAEQWYLQRLLAGEIAAPELNNADRLFVAGLVKTRRFEVWLGDGQNAAGYLDYTLNDSLEGMTFTFTLEVLSSDPSVTARVELDLSSFAGHAFNVYRDEVLVDTLVGGGAYIFEGLSNRETLGIISTIPEPSGSVPCMAAVAAAAVLTLAMCRRRLRRR